MLRFTSAGVVAAPKTVQIRVGASLRQGVAAGAPAPSADLSPDEVLEQVSWFTRGQRGPRGTPCDALVLSSVPPALTVALGPVVAAARDLGIVRVVAHSAAGDAPIPGVDERVVRFAGDGVAPVGGPWTAVVVLEPGAERAVAALPQARPSRVVFSWPFPADAEPLPAASVVTLLDAFAGSSLGAAVPWTIKGLPACLLGPHAGRQARTRNRWYVDADHRGPAALLFSPDVLRFSKADSCRFCTFDGICDGVASGWFDRGVSALLRPMTGKMD